MYKFIKHVTWYTPICQHSKSLKAKKLCNFGYFFLAENSIAAKVTKSKTNNKIKVLDDIVQIVCRKNQNWRFNDLTKLIKPPLSVFKF